MWLFIILCIKKSNEIQIHRRKPTKTSKIILLYNFNLLYLLVYLNTEMDLTHLIHVLCNSNRYCDEYAHYVLVAQVKTCRMFVVSSVILYGDIRSNIIKWKIHTFLFILDYCLNPVSQNSTYFLVFCFVSRSRI